MKNTGGNAFIFNSWYGCNEHCLYDLYLWNLMQVRDFIRSALYDPYHGYFSQRSGSVGVLENSIKFNQLQGISLLTITIINFVSPYTFLFQPVFTPNFRPYISNFRLEAETPRMPIPNSTNLKVKDKKVPWLKGITIAYSL